MSAIVDAAPDETAVTTDRRSRWAALRTGRGSAGVVLVTIVALAGLAAPWLAPYAPDEQTAGAALLGPSGEHLLGTDSVGRDILSRTLYGIRIDLVVIFLAVPAGAVIGSLLGLAATGTAGSTPLSNARST